MTDLPARPRLLLPAAVLALLSLGTRAPAQPTYKLDVKASLKPRATLSLERGRVVRSAVTDDPGFRLQYLFKKDGKAVATVEARSRQAADLPTVEAGTYTVVLELFHPDYKGGNVRKGAFKPISDVLTYRVEPGTPPRVTVVPSAKPATPPPPARPR